MLLWTRSYASRRLGGPGIGGAAVDQGVVFVRCDHVRVARNCAGRKWGWRNGCGAGSRGRPRARPLAQHCRATEQQAIQRRISCEEIRGDHATAHAVPQQEQWQAGIALSHAVEEGAEVVPEFGEGLHRYAFARGAAVPAEVERLNDITVIVQVCGDGSVAAAVLCVAVADGQHGSRRCPVRERSPALFVNGRAPGRGEGRLGVTRRGAHEIRSWWLRCATVITRFPWAFMEASLAPIRLLARTEGVRSD